MSKPKLIVMVGNIVSGKTTWTKEYLKTYEDVNCQESTPVVLSKDALRRMLGAGKYVYDEELEPVIHESLVSMLHHFMKNSISIILDETNMDKDTRNQYLFLTKNSSFEYPSLCYNYETIAVVIPDPTQEEITKRIRCRKGKPEWASASIEVWEEVWERNNSKFEMPTKEEGFDEIWEVDNE